MHAKFACDSVWNQFCSRIHHWSRYFLILNGHFCFIISWKHDECPCGNALAAPAFLSATLVSGMYSYGFYLTSIFILLGDQRFGLHDDSSKKMPSLPVNSASCVREESQLQLAKISTNPVHQWNPSPPDSRCKAPRPLCSWYSFLVYQYHHRVVQKNRGHGWFWCFDLFSLSHLLCTSLVWCVAFIVKCKTESFYITHSLSCHSYMVPLFWFVSD